ncbi:hypothetical protein JQX13_15790 [Archangium violaceum]|uniref:hypothetical protein n=1 Tax=Archangium violaceum TaxID=83451 RepID=UPI00193B4048|nr:hypothetical protein [Archangium violaceum]QRK11399.1 hypothetical protein JQX13_15790 [Archangium violaceum]
MPVLYLLMGLGLLGLWVVALAQGGVVGWFLWLTFGVAIGMVVLAILDFASAWRRRAT